MYLFISALFVGYRPVLNPPARMAPRALRHHSGELKPEMVTELYGSRPSLMKARATCRH